MSWKRERKREERKGKGGKRQKESEEIDCAAVPSPPPRTSPIFSRLQSLSWWTVVPGGVNHGGTARGDGPPPKVLTHLVPVVPSHINSFSFEYLFPAVEVYSQLVASQVELSAEFDMWKQKRQSVNVCDWPATAVDTLPVCSQYFFPNIHTLLVIIATLHVTTATAERTFFSLRLLKRLCQNNHGARQTCRTYSSLPPQGDFRKS